MKFSKTNPTKLAEQLADAALADSVFSENKDKVNYHVRNHKHLPDRCKPGELLKRLYKRDPELKESVKQLKGKHFQHRIK